MAFPHVHAPRALVEFAVFHFESSFPVEHTIFEFPLIEIPIFKLESSDSIRHVIVANLTFECAFIRVGHLLKWFIGTCEFGGASGVQR